MPSNKQKILVLFSALGLLLLCILGISAVYLLRSTTDEIAGLLQPFHLNLFL